MPFVFNMAFPTSLCVSYSCWLYLVLHALYTAPGLLDAPLTHSALPHSALSHAPLPHCALPHASLPHAPILPVAGVVHLERANMH